MNNASRPSPSLPSHNLLWTAPLTESLGHRPELTHRPNALSGRHGWLRLTPAYSQKLAGDLIAGKSDKDQLRVFDPFCGTGTTALCAAGLGHVAITTDINPFLLWFARAKTANYSSSDLAETRNALKRVLATLNDPLAEARPAPNMFNIERMWDASNLLFVRKLISAIDRHTTEFSAARDLLRVAFCRTLIGESNADFARTSMSIKRTTQLALPLDLDRAGAFVADVQFVLAGAAEVLSGETVIIHGDSRSLSNVEPQSVDLVVTSPPYVNRMSYIRELRPYMYWLGFLSESEEAAALDWEAIGGTWGNSTSMLNDWTPSNDFTCPQLEDALEGISQSGKKSVGLIVKYVSRYFEDMWAHFQALPRILRDGAEVHYVVGNSSFYSTLVPAEQIYAVMLEQLGFQNVRCVPLRRRGSKTELMEFDVIGTWP